VKVQQNCTAPSRAHPSNLGAEDDGLFVSRLVAEFEEHRKHVQDAVAPPRAMETPSLDRTLRSLIENKTTKDFVHTLVLQQQAHTMQLAVAAKFQPESLIRSSSARQELP
jgi:hypothetical protein